jgi:uncharacterized protein (TIGR03083 family)
MRQISGTARVAQVGSLSLGSAAEVHVELDARFDGSTANFVREEQAEFVSLLRALVPASWSKPSLCTEWSVRDVVVHTAAHIHNQQQDRTVISRYAASSESALVAWLEAPPAESTEPTYRACRRFAEIQRGELMIHQQDVRRALGIPRVIPRERVQGVLSFGLQPIGSLGLAFGRERTKGLRLTSTENDWRWGTGKEIRGTLEALLMATAGREVALKELDGPGVAVLADRMSNPPKVLHDLLNYSATVNPVQ